MKLTTENLKLNTNYKVISGGIFSDIKIGDTMMVQFEKCKRCGREEKEDEFTVFRWKREDEAGNKVWHWIKTIEEVFRILEPFEFELDKDFAVRQLFKLQLEINRIAYNYGIVQNFVSKIKSLDMTSYEDDWSFKNFVNEDGTMKDITIERFDSK